MYIIEQAPWERKREYFHHIQLGKDVQSQTNVLKNAIDNQIKAQLATASAIIASQERIAEGIGDVKVAIEDGMAGLQATFEWGISEIVWQLEQNREVLKSILEILQAPLDTQAKERRQRAENAYANGWIDDAEEEFLESEKLNRYDFAIHISLGTIYLFHKIDKKKALEYVDKAIKYAKPESKYYTSYALLHKALIKFDLGQVEKAEQCSEEATQFSPDFIEAYYQNSQYNAQLKNTSKSLLNLKKAILKDKRYCLKANNDSMFDPIRSDVDALFTQLRDDFVRASLDMCDSFDKTIEKFNESLIVHPDASRNFKNDLNKIVVLIKRNSFFDALEAYSKVKSLYKQGNDFIVGKKMYFSEKINEIETKIRHIISESKRETGQNRESLKKLIPIIWIFSGVITMALAIYLGSTSQDGSTMETLAIVLSGTSFALWFGGGFLVGKIITTGLGFMLYKEKDFSILIKEKEKEMATLKEHAMKLRQISMPNIIAVKNL